MTEAYAILRPLCACPVARWAVALTACAALTGEACLGDVESCGVDLREPLDRIDPGGSTVAAGIPFCIDVYSEAQAVDVRVTCYSSGSDGHRESTVVLETRLDADSTFAVAAVLPYTPVFLECVVYVSGACGNGSSAGSITTVEVVELGPTNTLEGTRCQ